MGNTPGCKIEGFRLKLCSGVITPDNPYKLFPVRKFVNLPESIILSTESYFCCIIRHAVTDSALTIWTETD